MTPSESLENRLRVGILLTPNFTLNALANFVDVFRLAADEADRSRPLRCQWHIMSPRPNPIVASCGVSVLPTERLLSAGVLDFVAVVGGLLYRGRSVDRELGHYLVDITQSGIPLIGICTGSFVLCRLGLMTNRRCCVSWFHREDFRAEFSDINPVSDELFVVDSDRLTTAGGIGSSMLAAHIVDSRLGDSVAQKALRIMQIGASYPLEQPAPTFYAASDRRVTAALRLMEESIEEALSIDDLASALSLARRSLERVFQTHIGKSPKRVYMEMRLSCARQKMQHGMELARAARESGFGSPARLRLAYRRYYGESLDC
jgi:transcriptional regulator GlxA family with amidase domain